MPWLWPDGRLRAPSPWRRGMHIKDAYGDYRQLLSVGTFNVVLVASPNDTHCQVVVEAAAAGNTSSGEPLAGRWRRPTS